MNKFTYYSPRRKLVENSYNAKHIAESGRIGFMCPECFHIVEADVSYSKSAYDIIDKIDNFHTSNEYYGECPKCKEDVKFIQLDGNMASIINILNCKGYFTAFCCEGHIEPDDYSGIEEFTNAYIYFYLWNDILNTYP